MRVEGNLDVEQVIMRDCQQRRGFRNPCLFQISELTRIAFDKPGGFLDDLITPLVPNRFCNHGERHPKPMQKFDDAKSHMTHAANNDVIFRVVLVHVNLSFGGKCSVLSIEWKVFLHCRRNECRALIGFLPLTEGGG